MYYELRSPEEQLIVDETIANEVLNIIEGSGYKGDKIKQAFDTLVYDTKASSGKKNKAYRNLQDLLKEADSKQRRVALPSNLVDSLMEKNISERDLEMAIGTYDGDYRYSKIVNNLIHVIDSDKRAIKHAKSDDTLGATDNTRNIDKTQDDLIQNFGHEQDEMKKNETGPVIKNETVAKLVEEATRKAERIETYGKQYMAEGMSNVLIDLYYTTLTSPEFEMDALKCANDLYNKYQAFYERTLRDAQKNNTPVTMMPPEDIIKTTNIRVSNKMIEWKEGTHATSDEYSIIDYRTQLMSEDEIISLYERTRDNLRPHRELTPEEKQFYRDKCAKLQENYAALIFSRKTRKKDWPLTSQKYRSELVEICREKFDEKPLFAAEITREQQDVIDSKEKEAQQKKAEEDYVNAKKAYESKGAFERLKMTIAGKKPKAPDHYRGNTK